MIFNIIFSYETPYASPDLSMSYSDSYLATLDKNVDASCT